MFQPNFVTFTNLEITERNPIEGNAFKGNQNGGFNFVRFSDGSGGIEKRMEDWTGNKTGRLYKGEVLAAQEYLAARVGEVMNAPIRDCLFTGSDAKAVIMPYIEGNSGLEDGDEFLPSNAQGVALKLFDFLTANADRRPKNWINTPDGRIVGIDHALCNFRPRQAKPELVAEFWNAGVTADALLILRPKLEALRPKFSTIGMDDKFIIMMRNLDVLFEALSTIETTVANVLHLKKDAFTPPAGVQETAKRALEWMADGKAGGGFTSVGRKRASDLARGAQVSEKTIRRMKAYFDRHQPDKDSPHWGEPSPGKVAWYAWGGDAGYSWAKKIVAQLNKKDEVKKGDVAGHEFHGNQWTQVGGHTADEHPKKWAKAIISELQAGRSPSIGQHELGILLKKVEQKQLEGSLTADITNLRINGTDLMGKEGLGYTREEMPQIPPKMREEFVADLEKQGISSTKELVDPTSLSPSQSEIGLAHVAHLYTVANGQIPQTKYLLASKDDYIVDGHHNWAADVALALDDPSQKVPILRIDAPAREVISIAHQWATEHGFESVPIGKARREAIEKADKKRTLNKKHSKEVKAAIIAGVVGVPLALKVAQKAAINATTDALGIIARNAVTTHVAIDSAAMGEALSGIYAEASSAGITSIASMLGIADSSAGKYIANVLQNSASILNGIDQTTKEMIISALQDGLVNGNSTDQISTSINDVVDNQQRAELIAVTEVNRAYNAGIIDMLANSGATQFNWIVRENGCTVCSEQEGAHDIGDDTPPLHPNCQCDIGQVVEKSVVSKGDISGHAFHGNQYTEGFGGGSISPEVIQEACWSREGINKLAEIFGNSGNYPTAGGCLVVAQAINQIYPDGHMKAIVTSSETHLQSYAEDNRPPMVEHFVVQIGKDRYLDADGVQSEHQLLTKYGFQMADGKYSQQLINATPFVLDHTSRYILSPTGAADKYADFLRNYTPIQKTTIVTKKEAGIIKAVVEKVLSIAKGDVAGHVFHGNQWQDGEGGASLSSFKESFDKAFKGSPFSAFVNHYSLEEMKSEGMKPLLSADGKTGLLIHDHGDGRIEATALFNNGESGAGLQLLKNAIDNHGVNYVECFGPALPVMYGKLGFEVESQNSFDPQYAPTDWNYEKFGTPDYYTMRITK